MENRKKSKNGIIYVLHLRLIYYALYEHERGQNSISIPRKRKHSAVNGLFIDFASRFFQEMSCDIVRHAMHSKFLSASRLIEVSTITRARRLS